MNAFFQPITESAGVSITSIALADQLISLNMLDIVNLDIFYNIHTILELNKILLFTVYFFQAFLNR